MKIIEILPELDAGRGERHVIDLSNELARRGYDFLAISAGGRTESRLLSDAKKHLPVHKKIRSQHHHAGYSHESSSLRR